MAVSVKSQRTFDVYMQHNGPFRDGLPWRADLRNCHSRLSASLPGGWFARVVKSNRTQTFSAVLLSTIGGTVVRCGHHDSTFAAIEEIERLLGGER